MWGDWAAEVLQGISATATQTNYDSLWAWSHAESGADVMRWNNPLNTTQPWAGATDANSVGVKIYQTELEGARATVQTLLNGYYPTIVAHLRNSVPHGEWGDACGELGTWGTGCGWIGSVYGPAPSGPVEDDMTPQQEALLNQAAADAAQFVYAAQGKGPDGVSPGTAANNPFIAINEKLAAIAAKLGSGGGTEPAEPKSVSGSFTGTIS